jgi:LacI family transcriptional regulator, repressor for deo operon, udp, cdd, tsx, nupC, and nupG
MTASIEDVARRAGVSIATVSRSLRGLPDVAESTRSRVLEAARELNYVASPFAAGLASGRTATVGVVVPFVNRWFFAEVLGAVESVLNEGGFGLLLYNLSDPAGRERFFATMPVRKRVDALLIASLVLSDEEAETVLALECPIGSLGVDGPGFHSTRIDDNEGARMAVRHLIEMGHTRIGLIAGDINDPMRFTPPQNRRAGFVEALKKAGIEFDPALEQLGYFTMDGGESATEALLRGPNRPTAIFAESDEMAYGAIRAIRRAHLRIPEDIAIIGFDDHASAALLDLSTIRQPVVEQAAHLTRRVLASLGAAVNEPEVEILPTQLIVRGSTDPSRSVY